MDTAKNDKKQEQIKFRVKRIKLASGKTIRIISIYSLLFILLAIPVTVTYLQQETSIQQRASGVCTPLPSCFYDNTCKYPIDMMSSQKKWCDPIKPVVIPTCVPLPDEIKNNPKYKITQTPKSDCN